MQELQNYTNNRTPIEVALQVDADGTISAKRVYEFLNMQPKHYARWCKSNIVKNDFAEESIDYRRSPLMVNGNLTDDFKLSISFAKKLCMLHKNEYGEQARDYFIKVEDTLKKMSNAIPQLSTNELILRIAQANVELEQQIKAQDAKLSMLQESQVRLETVIQELPKSDKDTWKQDIETLIQSIIATHKLSPIRFKGILYATLDSIEGVNLESRLTKLRSRMKKQGATWEERQAVTKLDIISKDKQLRSTFEFIVKEYQAK